MSPRDHPRFVSTFQVKGSNLKILSKIDLVLVLKLEAILKHLQVLVTIISQTEMMIMFVPMRIVNNDEHFKVYDPDKPNIPPSIIFNYILTYLDSSRTFLIELYSLR